mgnify:CR=1 FL=1
MYSDDDLLPLSGLQHMAFCERQWALIHVEGLWEESSDTLRGRFFHERVDTAGYSCRAGVRAERNVRLVSHRLGIYGVADIVEYHPEGDVPVMPVEYKVGKPKVEDWDRLQVCAQALCLEEMEGARIDAGALFYGETRRREDVEITRELRERVASLAQRMHELFAQGLTPMGENSGKCNRCSLQNECLPRIIGRRVDKYWKEYGLEDGRLS